MATANQARHHAIIFSLLLGVSFLPNLAMALSSPLSTKSIAIIGGGNVGSTIAISILQAPQAMLPVKVLIGARNVDGTRAKLQENGKGQLTVSPVDDAIRECDVLILTVPGGHDDDDIAAIVASLGGDEAVRDKIIIDATNPLSSFADGLQVRWGSTKSGGEVLQDCVPSARVYKAFNTLGVELMVRPRSERNVDMLYCGGAGGDDGARAVVHAVIAAVGFTPRYVGPIRYARNLEAMAELWIHAAIPSLPGAQLGRDWSFGMNGNLATDTTKEDS